MIIRTKLRLENFPRKLVFANIKKKLTEAVSLGGGLLESAENNKSIFFGTNELTFGQVFVIFGMLSFD